MFSIRSFVGPNGGGKTLAAVSLTAFPAWEKGRPVVANFRLYPERVGYSADLFRPLGSWREIPELEGVTLILDEITAVLPSRQSMSLPPQLARVLNQLRKQDVQLAWTAPDWRRADTILREVTQAVTTCVGMVPDRWQREPQQRWLPRAVRDDLGKRVEWESGWKPNRLFRWVTFDAISFEEFSQTQAKQLRPESVRRYWRSKHLAHLAYDTIEGVDLLDHLDDVGTCVVCGGRRSRPPCKCGPGEADAPEAEAGPGRGSLGRNGVGKAPVSTVPR